jgi:Ca2+-binding EF-hand superfamily protein
MKSKTMLSKPFIDKHAFRKITRGSFIDGKEELIFSVFCNLKKQINLNEVLAALVIYSASSWEEKCEFALKIGDLDDNEVISKDEMLVLCTTFIRSIGIVTRIPLLKKTNMKKLSQECFKAADSHPDGSITIFE